MPAISFASRSGLKVRGVELRSAPELVSVKSLVDNPNTDGIHLEERNNVKIYNSFISTGILFHKLSNPSSCLPYKHLHALLRKSKPCSLPHVALTSSKRGISTSTITNTVFNVLSVAAVGDDVTGDSKAFKNTACNASCSSQIFFGVQRTIFKGSCVSHLIFQYGYKVRIFSLSLLIVLMMKNSLAFGLDNKKTIVTLMAPDGLEAWSPKTSKQEWLVFISIKENVIARGWSYIQQRREMVESSWQA
ncbi:hypothetical protein CFP56_003180 [Quercus suber]|uniref:Uncharacterized protein n=1 Tax=Quercus suber TaxID=58331 RepID=A0AAW0IJG6_QUESU